MPAVIAPLVGFALGAWLAWAQRESLHREAMARRDTWIVGLFAGLVFAPAAGYFLVFAADWSYAYLLDASRIPSAVQLTLATGDAASVLAGYALARRALEASAPRALVAALALPMGLTLLATVALGARLSVDATYAQFHGGYGATPLAGSRLGAAVVWMDAVVAVGAVLAARALQRRRRREPEAPRAPRTRLLGQASQTERSRS